MRGILFVVIGILLVGAGVYYFVATQRLEPAPPPPTPSASGTGDTQQRGREVPVNLRTQNKSGETGVMSLVDVNGKVEVSIVMTNAPTDAPQPAHIHAGSCPTPGAVKYPLTSVVNGKSETVLDVSLDELLLGLPLVVNVHKSSSEANVYVACGDIGLDPILPKG